MCRDLRRTSRPFKPKKISTKKGVDLYGRVKNLNLLPSVVNLWNSVPNNRYILITVTPTDCHKHF